MNNNIATTNHSLIPACVQPDLQDILPELTDAFCKRQIFRTDTEARVSVLNDGAFPTPASKYWQAVREQAAMWENLLAMSFDFRRTQLLIRRTQSSLKHTVDPWEREELQIQLDEAQFRLASLELVARDRARELQMWSRIKQELDNGSFDTRDPNTHQLESLRLSLENRAQALTPLSGEAEVLNVLGPLNTINRALTAGSEPGMLPAGNTDQ